jgi:hypothetical protein
VHVLLCWCLCVCVCLCVRVRRRCVRENLYLHFLNFVRVCVQQGRHIAHKFESGWEVGVIKAFDKKLRRALTLASSIQCAVQG